MLDRLWIRLLAGMSLTLLVAVGTVAFMMQRVTSETFAEYVADVSEARAQRVDSVLRRHYQRHRSWAGVEPVIQLVADLSGSRVVLTDADGLVVADSQNLLVGARAQPDWARDPLIVTHQEKPVGSVYFDPLHVQSRPDKFAQGFLQETRRYLGWAAAAGLLAALIASLLLSRWLVAPIESLTAAVRGLAQGKLGQQIDVRVGGEVGLLAQAFNSTAAALARLERLRQRMVTDIAHELRTPLTNIRGYLEGIQDGVVQPTPETLGIIEYELGLLTRLVDDLQELAVVEAGQLALSLDELDVGALADLELRTLRPQADARGVALRSEVAPSLPLILADPGRIGQVLHNILRNALAHTPDGGSIVVRAAPDRSSPTSARSAAPWRSSPTLPESGVVLTIEDTGCGIDPEHLPHIFERFYRGDSARTRADSTGHGLGLTISRELVLAHGGEISATSTVGKGTTFTIRLPCQPRSLQLRDTAAAEQARPIQRPRSALALAGDSVLIGALLGAAVGLLEGVLVAVSGQRLAGFSQVFGYAMLLYGLLLGLLGGLTALFVVGLARLLGRRVDAARYITAWVAIGCLASGSLVLLQWQRHFDQAGSLAATELVFAEVVTLVVAGGLAILLSRLILHVGRRAGDQRPFSVRRLASLSLTVLGCAALAGVARDLALQSGLAAASAIYDQPLARPAAAAVSRPNVLLVTVDSLRADHIGATGYPKARTPTLDALASEGVFFSHAISNLPRTNPSHASLFTGTYPATNGLRAPMVDRLSPDLPTLAELLAERGYSTAGVYSWLSFEPAYSGLERGFRTYTDLTLNRPEYLADRRATALAATYRRLRSILALPDAIDRQMAVGGRADDQSDSRANVTTDGALEWLRVYREHGQAAQPFFLWVHYYDPREPFTPPPPFDQLEPDDCANCFDGGPATIRWLEATPNPELSAAQVNRLLQYYDGEIAFTDHELGRLLQELSGAGLLDSTLVVVVGSQGISFGEHGQWLHTSGLYGPEVDVPLLLRLPGVLPAGQTIDAVAQQIDLLPTILDLVDAPLPAQVEGRSLVPLIRGSSSGQERFAITETIGRDRLAVTTREWRLIKDLQDGSVELFRVADDPDELRDLADQESGAVAELDDLLRRWRWLHP
jgi:signal transduction histidine kinase/arylsulfatase A-like enzyme